MNMLIGLQVIQDVDRNMNPMTTVEMRVDSPLQAPPDYSKFNLLLHYILLGFFLGDFFCGRKLACLVLCENVFFYKLSIGL